MSPEQRQTSLCAEDTVLVLLLHLSAQDSWLADEFLGGSATALFGVFDGHGLDGRKVSNAIAARLPKLLAECPDFQARGPPALGAALVGGKRSCRPKACTHVCSWTS